VPDPKRVTVVGERLTPVCTSSHCGDGWGAVFLSEPGCCARAVLRVQAVTGNFPSCERKMGCLQDCLGSAY